MNARELQLGLLLIREGLITRDELKKALIKQGEIRRFGRHQRLGEVIVKLGYLAQEDIDGFAEVQEALAAPDHGHTPLGHLLIDRGLASPSQIFTLLGEQQFAEHKLGELLVNKGVITQEQLEELLADQAAERLGTIAQARPPI